MELVTTQENWFIFKFFKFDNWVIWEGIFEIHDIVSVSNHDILHNEEISLLINSTPAHSVKLFKVENQANVCGIGNLQTEANDKDKSDCILAISQGTEEKFQLILKFFILLSFPNSAGIMILTLEDK